MTRGLTIVGNGKTKAIMALATFIQAIIVALLIWSLADRDRAWSEINNNRERTAKLEVKLEAIQSSLDRIEVSVEHLHEVVLSWIRDSPQGK